MKRMSTWICKTTIVGALSLAVAGCGGPAFYTGGGGDAATTSRAKTGAADTQIAVANGAVVIAGPTGFCVDPASTQASTKVPFVVMGNCAAIAGNARQAQPSVKAVLTATAAPMDIGEPFESAALETYFLSENGQRALSRTNDPDTVSVLESFAEDDVFFMRAGDTSPGPVENLTPEHWRAYFEVNRHIVSATVLGFEDRAMSAEQGLSVLKDFTGRIRNQSDGAGRVAASTPTVTAAAADAAPAASSPRTPSSVFGSVGLFRRLLGS